MIKKVLVANRGEIAVRIIRAAKTLGIESVAVYSEVDSKALHVQMADEAVLLGPPEPAESYLSIERILAAANETGCDAIHPGYGFLAERAVFAQAVIDAGLTWIGPAPEVIDILGDKVRSREMMLKAGIPVTPGFASETQDVNIFIENAGSIGYPLLVKAAAGGGGKGMRIVRAESELKEAIEGAMREAQNAFGDSTIFLEKYIERPRPIEFQIFADSHGNAIHLYERECSIQRRHQKVVEETPSIAMDDDLRARMGEAAVATALAANYENAGTVEFLLDEDGSFYFLEVNTRIQVEHPVTEEVVGVDLVAEQFRIANGEKLSWNQSDLSQKGHAIEIRLYAEDPANNFLPAAGPVLKLNEPMGPGIRVDSGIIEGVDVPINYDPILSKLIAWGPDRDTAISRMLIALESTVILGLPTTATFLRDVVDSEGFRKGDTFTDFIPLYFDGWKEPEDANLQAAMIAATLLHGEKAAVVTGNGSDQIANPWQHFGNWRVGGQG